MCQNQQVQSSILFFAVFLFITSSVDASSFYSSSGIFFAEEVSVHVTWTDVYNMSPRPLHWSGTEIYFHAKKGYLIEKSSYFLKGKSRAEIRNVNPSNTFKQSKFYKFRQHIRSITVVLRIKNQTTGKVAEVTKKLQWRKKTSDFGSPLIPDTGSFSHSSKTRLRF